MSKEETEHLRKVEGLRLDKTDADHNRVLSISEFVYWQNAHMPEM